MQTDVCSQIGTMSRWGPLAKELPLHPALFLNANICISYYFCLGRSTMPQNDVSLSKNAHNCWKHEQREREQAQESNRAVWTADGVGRGVGCRSGRAYSSHRHSTISTVTLLRTVTLLLLTIRDKACLPAGMGTQENGIERKQKAKDAVFLNTDQTDSGVILSAGLMQSPDCTQWPVEVMYVQRLKTLMKTGLQILHSSPKAAFKMCFNHCLPSL